MNNAQPAYEEIMIALNWYLNKDNEGSEIHILGHTHDLVVTISDALDEYHNYLGSITTRQVKG